MKLINNKIILLIALLISLCAILNAQADWHKSKGITTEQITNFFRDSHGNLFCGTIDAGILISKDKGVFWDSINNGIVDYIKLANTFSQSGDTIYTSVGNPLGGHIYFSTDTGNKWDTLSFNYPVAVTDMIVIENSICASTGSYYFLSVLSTDRGKTWDIKKNDWSQYRRKYKVLDGTLFSLSNSYGLSVSEDKGKMWSSNSNNFFGINCYDYTIIDSIIIMSTELGLFSTIDKGKKWSKVCTDGLSDEGSEIYLLASNCNNQVYAASETNIYFSKMTNSNCTEWKTLLKDGLPEFDNRQKISSMICTESNLIIGTTRITNTDTKGLGVYYLDLATDVNKNPLISNELEMVPNPANKQLIISGSSPFNEITIMSINGAILFNKSTQEERLTINLTDYTPGVYIIKIQNKLFKFIKI
jgi:photosystem II stability/assembly factor-like uncharacterized protein